MTEVLTIPQGAVQVLTRKAEGVTRLAVLCPVYNEEQAIPLFLDRVMSVFSQLDSRYKPSLYFIDNGCTDASLNIIRNFQDRKSTRLNSSHSQISYAVFCLKKNIKSHPNPD